MHPSPDAFHVLESRCNDTLSRVEEKEPTKTRAAQDLEKQCLKQCRRTVWQTI